MGVRVCHACVCAMMYVRVRELVGKLVPGGKGVLRTAFRCSLIQAIGRINSCSGFTLFFVFLYSRVIRGGKDVSGLFVFATCSGWNTSILLTAEQGRNVTGIFKYVKECQPSTERKQAVF